MYTIKVKNKHKKTIIKDTIQFVKIDITLCFKNTSVKNYIKKRHKKKKIGKINAYTYQLPLPTMHTLFFNTLPTVAILQFLMHNWLKIYNFTRVWNTLCTLKYHKYCCLFSNADVTTDWLTDRLTYKLTSAFIDLSNDRKLFSNDWHSLFWTKANVNATANRGQNKC